MRKILLLLLLFITSCWQVSAQLKISTTATKLCEGTDIPLQMTGIPTNANVQFQRDGVDFLPFNVNAAILKPAVPGNYSAKAFSKDVKWSKKSPAIDYENLLDAFFINNQIGYAVGERGTIIKTTDGGTTWQNQVSNTLNTIRSVAFINELSGCAVGEQNTFLRTIDGGKNWTPVPKSSSWGDYNTFLNVRFIDSKNGIVTSDYETILKTSDGGNTWSLIKNTNETCFKISFINANTGFKTTFDAEGIIKRTTDGGKTWVTVYDLSKSDPKKDAGFRFFNNIYFLDNNTGWATEYDGLVVSTIDGGKTWTKRTGPFNGKTFSNIFFTDANTGWMTTFENEYLQTIDGGKNWILKNTGLSSSCSNSIFTDSKTGWMFGVEGSVIKTSNGGMSWEKLRGNTDGYTDITFLNTQTGFRTGVYGLIEKTTDGGNTWKSQNSTVKSYLSRVQFVDANTGWILSSRNSTMLNTTDGGNTWKERPLPVNQWVPRNFKFIDAKNGFAVASGATIAKTTDGGAVWSQVKTTLDTNVSLNSISFSDAKNGWIVGTSGTIAKTVDGGSTWTKVKIDSKYDYDRYASVFFLDTKNGWVISELYKLLKTVDGGVTWTEITTNAVFVNSIVFFDTKNGWISSQGGLLKTSDGGINWESVYPGTDKGIYGSFFLNAQTGWAVGSGNTYVKYEAPLLATSNTITINPKPAAPTLAWSNSDGKLTATTATTSPQLTWLKGVDELKNITATTYQPTSSGSYSVIVTDGNGCSEISKAVEITILASENPLNDSGVNVYPNPSSNGIFKVTYTRFSNEMDATMQIIGLDGLPLNSQKMIRQNNTFEGEINASNLNTGIYLLQVVSGEQKAVVKISIAK